MDVEVLERLEDKLKDAMIRRDNRMSLEEGILEHVTSVQSILAPSGLQDVTISVRSAQSVLKH